MQRKRTKTKETVAELPQELSSYLLLIQELLEEKGYVRGVELAERLDMSRPTVTRAIQRLAALGFANYERYRGITLSQAGIEAAAEASRRYRTVLDFLQATGVNMENQQLEARRLSASVSEDVLAAFKAATTKLRKA
jgi:Mn-dependent DtxR family transcriptional regulator